MNVICLEDEAFYTLIDEVFERFKDKEQGGHEDKWIGTDEALRLLRITSKTTLGNLRNQGKIRYSQPSKKIILYDRASIEEYLEQNVRHTF